MSELCNSLRSNDHVIEINDVDDLGWVKVGNSFIFDEELQNELLHCSFIEYDDADEENIRLLLSRAVGVEIDLYPNDKPNFNYNKVDDDQLAQLVELQIRMENGLDIINNIKEELKLTLSIYVDFKERVTIAKDLLSKWEKQHKGNNIHNWKYSKEFYVRLSQRNEAYKTYQALKDKLNNLWSHWFSLRDECMTVVGNNKALWAVFFSIEDKDLWMSKYLNNDYHYDCEDYDNQEHLKIKNNEQFEEYCISHIEEMNNCEGLIYDDINICLC